MRAHIIAKSTLPIFLICIASILLPIVALSVLPSRVIENDFNDFSEYYYPIAQNLVEGKGLTAPTVPELRLVYSFKDVSLIPTVGERVIVLTFVDSVLHFRILDDDGDLVVDTDEKKLPEQARRIEELKKQLESLWPPQKPNRSERLRVIASVRSIVGHHPPEVEFASRYPPGYPLILACVLALGRGVGVRDEVAVQAFSILSSTLAAVLIYLMVRFRSAARGPASGTALGHLPVQFLAHGPAL